MTITRISQGVRVFICGLILLFDRWFASAGRGWIFGARRSKGASLPADWSRCC